MARTPEESTLASAFHAPRARRGSISWSSGLALLPSGGYRPACFTSLAEPVEAIELWAEHWNNDPKPFIWHPSAEEVITKVPRGRATLTEVKSATRH